VKRRRTKTQRPKRENKMVRAIEQKVQVTMEEEGEKERPRSS
jgi:hypothetical protein